MAILEDSGQYGYPVKPDMASGKPALQVAAEAMERDALHTQWHKDNPDNFDCPPELCQPGDYADMQRGQNLTGGMTIEPGDGFVVRGGK